MTAMSETCREHKLATPCPTCSGRMLLIGSLPNLPPRRRVSVFRCENCDYVIAQEDASASAFSASLLRASANQGP